MNPQRGVRLVGVVCSLENVAALTVDGRPERCASGAVDDSEAYMFAFVAIGPREDDCVGIRGISRGRLIGVTGLREEFGHCGILQ